MVTIAPSLRASVICEAQSSQSQKYSSRRAFSCARICCRILVGASLGFYAEELALMEIKKSSAALRIGAFGKYVASHARRRSFRDVLRLLRLENKKLDLSSGGCGNFEAQSISGPVF